MTAYTDDTRGADARDRRLGQRVRTRRLEIGMSQERLAEILGVTFQQVQKYEKGVNRIAAMRLWDICTALEHPIGRFFEGVAGSRKGARGEPELTGAEDVLATSEGVALMEALRRIPPGPARRRLVDFVRAAADLATTAGA